MLTTSPPGRFIFIFFTQEVFTKINLSFFPRMDDKQYIIIV